MQREGKGRVLDQFANADNPRIHYETTGPELWEQTGGSITHFVSAMGTTGTITGVSRFLKEKNPAIRSSARSRSEGSRIPGIRKWPQEYLPKIYDPRAWTSWCYVSQDDAEDMCRRLAREEGIFAGISAAGACWVAQEMAKKRRERHHRVCGVRPGRPLPVHRRVPGMTAAFRFCPSCATPLQLLAQRNAMAGRRRRQAAPALPRLWLDALEQPDAGAGGGDGIPGQILLARNAAWPGACLR
jgi:hypothetical protein